MPQKLIKHGTRTGYDAELAAGGPGNVCDRCRAAKRVYQSQYYKGNKARGIKYRADQVIDHLDTQRYSSPASRQRHAKDDTQTHDRQATDNPIPRHDMPENASDTPPQSQVGPSLGERLGDSLRNLVSNRTQDEYVSTDEIPDYIHPGEPDPEPSADMPGPEPDEFVINKAGMVLIEDNLGTYLSVVGITLEMIDPYCGPILAENFDNIVGRWSKVIARYPRAAKLFMSKDGGTLFAWIGAIQATWPVLMAIYDHHLADNVKTDNLGRAYRVNKPVSNVHVDATTPPMHNYEYTVN